MSPVDPDALRRALSRVKQGACCASCPGHGLAAVLGVTDVTCGTKGTDARELARMVVEGDEKIATLIEKISEGAKLNIM